MRTDRSTLIALAFLVFAACSGDSGQIGATGPKGGSTSGNTGGTINLNDPSLGTGVTTVTTSGEVGKLSIIVRDFRFYSASDKTTNPDFENVPKTDQNGNPNDSYLGPWDDRDIVADTLGSDGKPVYKNASGKTVSTHGKAAFDQWFNDVPGTNIRVEYPLELTKDSKGNYAYDSQVSGVPVSAGSSNRMFFPIDDGSPYKTSFGNQGQAHNFSFTVEMHTRFTYNGGEFFHFRGDDDVFVYINNKLVINLGGIHGAEQADVNLDTLGLQKGTEYPLDFFYAERHVTMSNLLVTTSLALTPAKIF